MEVFLLIPFDFEKESRNHPHSGHNISLSVCASQTGQIRLISISALWSIDAKNFLMSHFNIHTVLV